MSWMCRPSLSWPVWSERPHKPGRRKLEGPRRVCRESHRGGRGGRPIQRGVLCLALKWVSTPVVPDLLRQFFFDLLSAATSRLDGVSDLVPAGAGLLRLVGHFVVLLAGDFRSILRRIRHRASPLIGVQSFNEARFNRFTGSPGKRRHEASPGFAGPFVPP